jgi:hypothetical protein
MFPGFSTVVTGVFHRWGLEEVPSGRGLGKKCPFLSLP